jgi:hypothetical protein
MCACAEHSGRRTDGRRRPITEIVIFMHTQRSFLHTMDILLGSGYPGVRASATGHRCTDWLRVPIACGHNTEHLELLQLCPAAGGARTIAPTCKCQ